MATGGAAMVCGLAIPEPDLVRVGADGSLHWLRVWPTPEEHPRHAGLELWMVLPHIS